MPAQINKGEVVNASKNLRENFFLGLRSRPTLTFFLLVLNILLLIIIFFEFGFLFYPKVLKTPKIHTLQSTVTKGQETKIPDYFLKTGIPIYKDAELVQVTEGETTTTVILKSKDDFIKVKQFYTDWLDKEGWEKEIIKDQEGSIALSGRKEKTNLSVIVVKNLIYSKVATNSPVAKITGEETTINLAINRQ